MIILNYPHVLFSRDGWKCYKLRRLYFIWVCRDIESFRWFADLLCMLHNKVMGVVWRVPDSLNAGYAHTTHLAFCREWQPCSKGVSSSSSLGYCWSRLHLFLEMHIPVWVSLTNVSLQCCHVQVAWTLTCVQTTLWDGRSSTCGLGRLEWPLQEWDLQFQVYFKSHVAS